MSTTESNEPIHTILVPTDFSENARTALTWAIQIARTHGASMTLLHVADVVALRGLPLPIQEQIARSLQSLEEAIREDGVEAACIQRAGRPWARIAAEADAFDLVVLGARGQTPRTVRLLGIGSTAARVLRSSPTPVLTVHGDDPPSASPRSIIVPTDFSDSAALALNTVVNLLRPTADTKLSVTLLHAWQPLVDYECAFAGGAVLNPVDGTEEQAREILETQAAKVRSAAVEITPLVRVGYPAQVIEEEAQASQAELIALGTHGRSGLSRWMLGSVAERVVHHAHCPVLTVRQVIDVEDEDERSLMEQVTDAG